MNREVFVKPVAMGTGGRGQVVESTSLALLFKTPFDIITCVKGQSCQWSSFVSCSQAPLSFLSLAVQESGKSLVVFLM